jgi:hypothetical protein
MLSDIQDSFKHERDQFNEDFKLRIHRTLSWLQRAEQAQLEQDLDSQFIFLWIGFNANRLRWNFLYCRKTWLF